MGQQQNTWYQKEDFVIFQSQIKGVVKSFNMNHRKRKFEQMMNEEEYCTRGIEKYLSQNNRTEMKKLQRAYILCVLKNQRNQKKGIYEDPKGYQAIAHNISRDAQIKARKLGVLDENEAL